MINVSTPSLSSRNNLLKSFFSILIYRDEEKVVIARDNIFPSSHREQPLSKSRSPLTDAIMTPILELRSCLK